MPVRLLVLFNDAQFYCQRESEAHSNTGIVGSNPARRMDAEDFQGADFPSKESRQMSIARFKHDVSLSKPITITFISLLFSLDNRLDNLHSSIRPHA
jgi:hypothetical protein